MNLHEKKALRSGGKDGKPYKSVSGTNLTKMTQLQAFLNKHNAKIKKEGETYYVIGPPAKGGKESKVELYQYLRGGAEHTTDDPIDPKTTTVPGLGGAKGKNTLYSRVLADILTKGVISKKNVEAIHNAGYSVQSFYDALGGGK